MTNIESFNHAPNEVNRIRDLLNTVMEPRTGRVTRQNIIERVKKLSANDLNNLNFARALVEFVRLRNTTNIRIDDIVEPPSLNSVQKRILNATWIFRHYSNAPHATLQSLAQLTLAGLQGANTNDADWEQIGNTGYVFGLIILNGHIPEGRTWLKGMTHYADYPLRNFTSVWVSGDMLDIPARTGNSYQGTGENVVRRLAIHIGMPSDVQGQGNPMATQLDRIFTRTEAKVPPTLLGKPDWKTVR